MRKLLRALLITSTIALTAAGPSSAQREVVDEIVAVVGDRVILASELAGQVQWTALQTNRQPRSESELLELQREILDQMVSDQLFLIAAKKDTTINVRPEEIEQALDDRVAAIANNFPSQADFIAALDDEGLTLRELRKRFRSEIENQLIKQRYIQQKLQSVSISRHEVEQFYRRFKDSIPDQPEGAKLSHILLTIQPSQAVEDSVKTIAERLRDSIMAGAEFARISSQYSSMGAGENGGDLGYVARDDVVEEFARAAFNLDIGQVSGVVRTRYGYHVIKCEGKRDDRLKLRHLLLSVLPSPQDTARTAQLADSLLQAARNGDSFEEMAKVFSADNETRAQGGELGWFATAELPPEFADAVAGWTTPGEYRGPVLSQLGIHILKLLDYQPRKKLTLEEDFDDIKQLARQDKTGKIVDEWIESIKAKTHIEYRLTDQDND